MDSSRIQIFGRTLERGSEEVYDYVCTVCDIIGVVKKAEHYCASCDYLYCKKCYTDKDSEGHRVVKVSDWGEQSSDICQVCQREGTRVSKHCVEHDQSCCLHCAVTEHSSCLNVSSIDQLASGVYTSKDFNSLKNEIEQKIDAVKKMKIEKKRLQMESETSRQNSLERLDDFMKKVREISNKLEHEAEDEIDADFSGFDYDLGNDIEMCEDILASLRLQKMYMECGKATKPKMFMKLKDFRHNLTEYDKSSAMEEPLLKNFEEYEFNVNHTVKKLIHKIESLKLNSSEQYEDCNQEGHHLPNISTAPKPLDCTSIERQRETKTADAQAASKEQVHSFEREHVKNAKTFKQAVNPPCLHHSATPDNSEEIQRNAEQNTTLPMWLRSNTTYPSNIPVDTNVRKYNVRLPSDDAQCSILGMFGLSNGTILLSDTNNKKLKLIDRNYKVINHCKLPAKPRGVCLIDEYQAVTALSNKTLQFVTLATMTPSRSISLSHRCYGLTHWGGRMYVAEPNGECIYVYDTFGNHVCNISQFASIQHVYITRDGTRIYVTDSKIGLVVLNSNGTRLSTNYPTELKYACGVCTDKSGNVYVSGYRSHNVIKFEEFGTQVGDAIVSRENGIGYPTSIWFNSTKSQLIVSHNPESFGCDYLYVFDVTRYL